LTYSMMEQLDDHVTTLERWTKSGHVNNDTNTKGEDANNSRAVILTGSQGHFCSGLDLHDHADRSVAHPLRSGTLMNLHMTQLTNRIHSLCVPSIAAVDGNAVGGGAELTTCTDFVVLSSTARVQFVHVRRGASPGWGGGRRLVNRVGRNKALRMLLLGECILGSVEGRALCYADGVGEEGETAVDAAMRLIVAPLLELPCSKAIRAVKSVVSAANGDKDVLDVEGGTMFYDTNNALAVEREAFVSVWGGDSNLRQIQETKDKLKEKKKPY
jgi:enoyl-CoA hydratase/carnithine racemase